MLRRSPAWIVTNYQKKKKEKKNNLKFVEAYSNSFDGEYKIMDVHDFKTNIQIVHSTVDDHSKRQNSIF